MPTSTSEIPDSGALSAAVHQVGIGIDPGLGENKCGLAAIYINQTPELVQRRLAGPEPWASIHGFVINVAQRYQLRFIAIENPLGVLGRMQRTGETNLKAWRLLEVVGFARALALALHTQFIELDPQVIKRAVGAPRTAKKKQIIQCIQRICIGCPSNISEHEADATATAYAGNSVYWVRAAQERAMSALGRFTSDAGNRAVLTALAKR
jgi:Holliday junction resolvasome RuvABC endonuclease subunit